MIDFNENEIEIESKNIKLRPLKLEELTDLILKKYNELKINIEREALIESAQNAMAKKVIKMEKVNKNFHKWYTYWLIIDKETSNGIGFIGFKGIPDEKGYVEVGYSISPLHRRKGLMTEALKAIIVWAEEEKNCKGITAYALKTNIASQKLLINCGFKTSSVDEYINFFILQFNLVENNLAEII